MQEISLERDLFDTVTIVVPSTARAQHLEEVTEAVVRVVSEACPTWAAFPYGSMVTNHVLGRCSDVDITLVGNSDEYCAASVIAGRLESEHFEMYMNSGLPCAHPNVRPKIRCFHPFHRVWVDITFNQLEAVQTSHILGHLSFVDPLAAFMVLVVKAIVRGAELPVSCISSVCISVAVHGFMASLRYARQATVTFDAAFYEFTRFFGREMLLSEPQTVQFSVDGITRQSPSSPFSNWNILEPVTGRNLAERCTQVRDFALLMDRVHTAVRDHYSGYRRHRPPGSAHLIQLLPPLSRFVSTSSVVLRMAPPLAQLRPSAAKEKHADEQRRKGTRTSRDQKENILPDMR